MIELRLFLQSIACIRYIGWSCFSIGSGDKQLPFTCTFIAFNQLRISCVDDNCFLYAVPIIMNNFASDMNFKSHDIVNKFLSALKPLRISNMHFEFTTIDSRKLQTTKALAEARKRAPDLASRSTAVATLVPLL